MALLWQKIEGETRYEVRSAGATRRLYTNGVFHSQFNPHHLLTGGVWDLLLLAAFMRPLQQMRRVLVLGVGGGAVIRQLQYFVKPAELIGIDINPVHLQVAKRFFRIGKNANVIAADAVEWIAKYEGPRFDLVIEDLFGHERGAANRSVSADKSWCRSLMRHVNHDGVLAMNFSSPAELRKSALVADHGVSRLSKSKFSLTTPLDENAVGIFTRQPANGAELRRRLRQFPQLDTRRRTTRLKYSLRTL